jgi:hypothetical protein
VRTALADAEDPDALVVDEIRVGAPCPLDDLEHVDPLCERHDLRALAGIERDAGALAAHVVSHDEVSALREVHGARR